ncbi:MAG: M1 family peptidase, partial [Myxococcota bacterium]
MARIDPHSYTDTAQGVIASVLMRLTVDFGAKSLSGEATLTFRQPVEGPLDLDTRDLRIDGARTKNGEAVPFDLGERDPVLGSRLRLTLPSKTREVTISYATSPTASALQWLEPAHTAGGKHPYLFSQCQPHHARSVVPLQDSATV